MKVIILIIAVVATLGFGYGYITLQDVEKVGQEIKTLLTSERADELIESAKGVGGSFIPSNPKVATASSTTWTLNAGTGDTQILASSTSNPKRAGVEVQNDCTSDSIYVSLDQDKPMIGKRGIRLNANGGTLTISPESNYYTGAIHASSTSACEVIVTEYLRPTK